MAFNTSSGLYYLTIRDSLANTIALDMDGTDNKIALYSNSIGAMNYDTDSVLTSSPYTSNELTGGSWAAGGYTLVSPAFSVSTGTMKWTATDVSQGTCTITNARGGIVYGLAAGTKNLIAGLYFGGSDYSTNNGTFAINWNAAGIFTIDLTP